MNQLIKHLTLVKPVYAGEEIDITPKTTEFQPLTNLTVPSIISGLISLVLVVATLVFFFILVLGGIKWITSGGDEKAVGAARSQITNALIGLAIIFVTWAIIRLIGSLFGIDIFKLTLPTF